MPMSDQEQIQMIKGWWKEYGYTILFTILAFMLANFGWRYWQKNSKTKLEHASVIYTQMLNADMQHKKEETKLFGQQLIKSYAKSPYASLAAFILAKMEVGAGNFKAAQEKLQFVIEKGTDSTLRQLARLRAARLLIELKQSKVAIDLLAKIDEPNYAAEISEILGDAYLELGQTAEAEKAYQKAQSLGAEKMQAPMLKLKLRQF